MTGPQTRQWLMEKITGDTSDDYSYTPPLGLELGRLELDAQTDVRG